MAARRAAGEPLQYVFGHWPFRIARPPRRPARADPASRDRAGRRGGPGRGAPSGPRPGGERRRRARRGRRRHRQRCHRAGAGGRAGTPGPARGVGHRRQRRRPGRGRGEPRCAARRPRGRTCRASSSSGGAGSSRSRRRCAARSTWSSPTRPTSPRTSGPGCRSEVRAEPRQALVAGPGSDGTARPGGRGGRAGAGLALAGPPRDGRGRAGAPPGRRRRWSWPGGSVSTTCGSSPTWRDGRVRWWRAVTRGGELTWRTTLRRQGGAPAADERRRTRRWPRRWVPA